MTEFDSLDAFLRPASGRLPGDDAPKTPEDSPMPHDGEQDTPEQQTPASESAPEQAAPVSADAADSPVPAPSFDDEDLVIPKVNPFFTPEPSPEPVVPPLPAEPAYEAPTEAPEVVVEIVADDSSTSGGFDDLAGLFMQDAPVLPAVPELVAKRTLGPDDFDWMIPNTSGDRLAQVVDRLRAAVAEDVRLSSFAANMKLTRDGVVDREQRRQLRTAVGPVMMEIGVSLHRGDHEAALDLLYDDLLGLGPLGPIWRDDRVTEICVDSWDRITVQVAGHWMTTPLRFRSLDHAQTIARNLALKVSDRALSKAIPLVTAVLPGGRVQFAYDPVSDAKLTFVIRKFKPLMGMEGLLAAGALSQEAADFLNACVKARANVLIAGTTNSGKTTAINALSEAIPAHERVICIEDARELMLSNEHVVYLQTKEQSSVDDSVSVGQADLLRACLRMSPDRILVGEIREPAGAVTMLDAATTGHDGTMTTIHAGSPSEAVNQRMASLVRKAAGGSLPDEVAKGDVASAFDLVVQLTFDNGRRFMQTIASVDIHDMKDGMVNPRILFQGSAPGGVPEIHQVAKVRADTSLGRKLRAAGFTDLLEHP